LKYITKTGRALRSGKTTRASLRVKRPKVKPLPLHLQCYPQALHRTPTHPACATFVQPEGYMRAMASTPIMRLLTGSGLSKTPDRVRVVIEGHGTWYAHDSAHAFAWARSAHLHALTVKVYIDL
jgi:hypothetical protein